MKKPFLRARLAVSLIGQIILLSGVLFPVLSQARSELQVCDSHGLVRGAEIAVEKGCFGCHTLGSKRIGPPYRDIATRYEREPTKVSALAKKIKNGGSGVWGTVIMPPNTVTDEESEILARWILAL